MIRGIYCSNTGLNAMESKLDSLAHNLANANTAGFKQEKIYFRNFINEREGVKAGGVATDFRNGSVTVTGRTYDFAVSGDTFFTVNTENGPAYTQAGSFQCDSQGYLYDQNGNQVVGVTGAVKMVDGKPDQDFYLVDILNKETLSEFNLGFTASDATVMSQNTNLKPVQGSLENSNVDMIYNLSEMITTARGHSFNSKMISYQDELLKKATEEIGSLK